MTNKSGIAISTTVGNLNLYKKTVASFPDVQLYKINGSEGFFGMESILYVFKKLRHKKIKWLVLVDEDVVFANQSAFFSLIDHMEKKNIDVGGIRDGGMLSWRNKNPYLLNPFFCVLNYEKLMQFFDEDVIRGQDQIQIDEFDDDLSKLPYPYDALSDFEEYYPVFLWLRRLNFSFYFLPAASNIFTNDLETTEIKNQDNKIILYHTWYARLYDKNERHTHRINNVLRKSQNVKPKNERKIIVFNNIFFFLIKKLNRLKRKIVKNI